MGCDIHTYCEVLDNGEWCENTELVFPHKCWDGHTTYNTSPEHDRWYIKFSFLAGVRNSTGIQPIVPPRGIPFDCTKVWKEKCEYWNYDLHSHSFLYISDFNNFDWDKKFYLHTSITLKDYIKYRERGYFKNDPEEIDIFFDTDVDLKPFQADLYLKGFGVISKGNLCARPDMPHRKIAVTSFFHIQHPDFLKYLKESWYEPMKLLKKKYDDVRVLYAFDN